MVKEQIFRTPLLVFFIGILGLCVFVVFIFIDKLSSGDYKVVSKTDKIDDIKLIGYEEFGSLRAAVFYKKNRFISGSSPLVKSECKDEVLINYNINPRDLKTVSHGKYFRISDLNMPFVLSKEANSDTIVIKKDGCVFYFKMYEYDGPYK